MWVVAGSGHSAAGRPDCRIQHSSLGCKSTQALEMSIRRPHLRRASACRGAALVFVNGSILGVHRRPTHFAATLRTLRRRGCVGPYVSVFAQQDAVYLACDGGRVCRPLIVCDAGHPRVTSEHMQATLCQPFLPDGIKCLAADPVVLRTNISLGRPFRYAMAQL